MIPQLSDTAFWDVDFESLDAEKDAAFIVQRVFNYGLWNDHLAIFQYYSPEQLKTEAVKAAWYKKKVLSFLCVIFELQPSDFVCYTRRQSQPQHWNY